MAYDAIIRNGKYVAYCDIFTVAQMTETQEVLREVKVHWYQHIEMQRIVLAIRFGSLRSSLPFAFHVDAIESMGRRLDQ